MKYLISIFATLLLSAAKLHAQTAHINPDSIYIKEDILPEFPGGMKALGKYVDGKNHHFPEEARKNKIEGKVMVQFIINADGICSECKVLKGNGYGCDEAAVEAFKKRPKWKPATVNGQPVRFKTQMGYLYGL